MDTSAPEEWLAYLEPVDIVLRRLPLFGTTEVIEWRVRRPVTATVDEHTITVPVGFETDLASVPALVWWLYPPHGPWALDAVVHDYLYTTKQLTRAQSDYIYRTLLRRNPNVSFRTAWIHWVAIRAGGWWAWRS